MGLEHYTRIRDLGGSNGAFLACDRQDPSRKVVIKRLADGAEGMTELNLSLRARHAHIVKMLEFFIHDGELYGVIKYEEGGDLASLISRLRELEVVPKEVTLLRWFEQLLSALHFCHDERRILHRDIKPSNIFLSSDDKQLFLGDFGSAKALAEGTQMTNTFVGSPMWISPEVLLGHGYTFPSDVWSLGCVFFEMATLRHPFHAHNFAHLVTKVTSGETVSLPEAVPASVRHIVTQMMRFDPTQRATAGDLLRETRAALPEAEAAEMANRRGTSVVHDAVPAEVTSSPTKVAPVAPPASSSSSPASQPLTGTAAGAPPPPGVRTCTPTQLNVPSAPAPAPSAARVPTHAPVADTPTPTRPADKNLTRPKEPVVVADGRLRAGGGHGASGAVPPKTRTQVPGKQVAAALGERGAAAIPSLVTAAEAGGAAIPPGELGRQIENRLKNRHDSDSDSEDTASRQLRVANARDPLSVQGRRLSVDPAEADTSAARTSTVGTTSGSRRGSVATSASRASASAGRQKANETAANRRSGNRAVTGPNKAPAMRQRWYDRTPKPNTTAGKRAPAQTTSYLGARDTPTVAVMATPPKPAKPDGSSAFSSPTVDATPTSTTTASAEPTQSGGVKTWLAQHSDEASDIELYLRKFRDHDDAVLRTYDEREANGEAPFVVDKTSSPSPPAQSAPPRAPPKRERQSSRRVTPAGASDVAGGTPPAPPAGVMRSPPRVPRRKTADPPVNILVGGGGGAVCKAPPQSPPPSTASAPRTRSTEPSLSPTPSAVRVRRGANSAARRHKAPSPSNASPAGARFFSPKYERQPSALRAPLVASHHPRQASHARPQPQYTAAERHEMEMERQEAKERREADRKRMKEMIRAQRAQQKPRHSVDVEIKLPDDMAS